MTATMNYIKKILLISILLLSPPEARGIQPASGPNPGGHSARAISILQTAENHSVIDQTINNGTAATLSGSSLTASVTSGSVVVFECSFSTRTASILGAASVVTLMIDGVSDYGTAQTYPALAGATQGSAIIRRFTVGGGGIAAGSHTWTLQLTASGGNSRVFAASAPGAEHVSCVLMEIG